MVDGKIASVSSVNWSKNSFTNDREAGVVIEGSSEAIDFLKSVFDDDWEAGDPYKVTETYSTADMAIITSKTTREVNVPPGPVDRHYVTPVPEAITGTVQNFTVLTSPDYAYSAIMDMINAATESVQFYVYQITDERVCDAVEALHKKGINVTVLVSKGIYSTTDEVGHFFVSLRAFHLIVADALLTWKETATKCYTQLQDAGLDVHMSWQYNDYMYSHNKYWIVDGKKLGLSSGNLSPTDIPGTLTSATWLLPASGQ